MSLDREALIDLAVQKYFVACNRGDLDTVLGTFASDCRIGFASADFEYRGTEALEAHFKEFRNTFRSSTFGISTPWWMLTPSPSRSVLKSSSSINRTIPL